MLVVYGFFAYTLVGALYGPSLWLEFATLNVIFAGSDAIFWFDVTVPVTVSPTWKTPDFIVISNNLGVQYFVTLIPSKKAYNLDCGLNPLPSNVIFLDLIIGIVSLLTVLSPTDSWSKVSVINCLVPDLVEVPVWKVLVIVSWNVSVISWLPCVLVCLLVWLWGTCSDPVHTVCQPPHKISVKPVCGSRPWFFSASAMVVE